MSDMSVTLRATGDRWERRRARTRSCLLDAARRVLARLGFQAATVADITDAADLGVGTFYLHFRDKEELAHTLLAQGLEELRATVAQAIATTPLARSLPVAIHAICAAIFAQRDLFRIAYTSGSFLDLSRQGQDMLARYLTNAIEAARADGLIAADLDAPLTARLITGMIIQGVAWWSDHAEPAPDVMADQIIHLLRAGLPAALFA